MTHARDFGLFFLLCLAMLLGSYSFVSERIQQRPQPTQEERFHQHLGDGSTEHGWVLPALAYWQEQGIRKNWGIPCHQRGEGDACAKLYTHYPPGSFLLSHALLAVGGRFADEAPLKAARFIYYGLCVAITALALLWLGLAVGAPWWTTVLVAAFAGSSYGFRVYSDNLFAHGLVTALLGLSLAALARFHSTRRVWFFRAYVLLSMIQAYFTWETLPALCLLPLTLEFLNGDRFDFRAALKASLLTFSFILIVLAARLVQNSLALGGVAAALADWATISQTRGAPSEIVATTLGGYVHYSAFTYKRAVGWIGVAAIVFGIGAMVFRRNVRLIAAFGLVSIGILFWNVLMVPHSQHHCFTHRYILWPCVLALFLGWQQLRNPRAKRPFAESV